MTETLVRLFVKNSRDTTDPAVRTAYGNLASWVGIFCNLLLCAGKFLAGTLSGSISIAADAVNNLSDASSSVVSLIGFKLGARPADDEHPYGHARFEYLAGLAVAVMVLVIGVELLKSSVEKILHPAPVTFSWVAMAVLAVSIAVKLWMSVFNRTVGKRINSGSLIATAADSRNDVLTTSAVLIASLISHFAKVELDGWMGAAVALFILYSGVGLVKDTIDPLLGLAPDPELVQHIHDKIMSYPGVLGTHDLMVHDYGPGRQFASVHVELAAEDDVMASHELIDDIERDFLKNDRLPVVIHFDPIVTSDAQVGDMRRWLAEAVRTIDPSLSIHDLRMVPGVNHINIIFDCVTPPGFAMSSARLKEAIAQLVSEKDPSYRCVITVETSFAAVPCAGEAVQ
ncbi:MAG TPA: cation diffusion facilitator family transporter [Candidatus Fournierella pullicola]|uniref:Cation diffusion facilitator family transporter n=1 Tax=Candidatus Allofournierella pullicola TaxID=2838596 RepID=A0A9D1V5T1_9FIRM|nr:cation diffusion facilitator family transporter [Candidatus Fournierella pullicola]